VKPEGLLSVAPDPKDVDVVGTAPNDEEVVGAAPNGVEGVGGAPNAGALKLKDEVVVFGAGGSVEAAR